MQNMFVFTAHKDPQIQRLEGKRCHAIFM